jgi:transposase
MIDLLKRHEIHVLRRAGHTWREVAALAGVSVGTARRVVAADIADIVDNAAAPGRRQKRVGRPSPVGAYRDVLAQALTEDATLPLSSLLDRARQAGYTGGKSALSALVRTLRESAAAKLAHGESVAGEFSQHDFGTANVRYQDGRARTAHFFASRLKYSRWLEVTLVSDQEVDTLVRTFLEHLSSFGGVPLVAVFARPKTVALRWNGDGEVTEWNPTFADVALNLGLGVQVCWPYRPKDLVGWVKSSFFTTRQFMDEHDLSQQLADWITETNTLRPAAPIGVPPAERIENERARLRPLRDLAGGPGASPSVACGDGLMT